MTGGTGAKLERSEDDPTAGGALYDLTLFVSGASSLSGRAIANARELCEQHLDGQYHLSVVDIHVDPDALVGSLVLAVPTMIKNRPGPERRVVGDLSHPAKVLQALDIPFAP
jgi:circadian clock protein KaiB